MGEYMVYGGVYGGVYEGEGRGESVYGGFSKGESVYGREGSLIWEGIWGAYGRGSVYGNIRESLYSKENQLCLPQPSAPSRLSFHHCSQAGCSQQRTVWGTNWAKSRVQLSVGGRARERYARLTAVRAALNRAVCERRPMAVDAAIFETAAGGWGGL